MRREWKAFRGTASYDVRIGWPCATMEEYRRTSVSGTLTCGCGRQVSISDTKRADCGCGRNYCIGIHEHWSIAKGNTELLVKDLPGTA